MHDPRPRHLAAPRLRAQRARVALERTYADAPHPANVCHKLYPRSSVIVSCVLSHVNIAQKFSHKLRLGFEVELGLM